MRNKLATIKFKRGSKIVKEMQVKEPDQQYWLGDTMFVRCGGNTYRPQDEATRHHRSVRGMLQMMPESTNERR